MSWEKFVQRASNPLFKMHFQQVTDRAKIEIWQREILLKNPSEKKVNAYLGKDFMTYFLEYSLPSIPNWSAILLHDIGRHGDSKCYRNHSKTYNLKTSSFNTFPLTESRASLRNQCKRWKDQSFFTIDADGYLILLICMKETCFPKKGNFVRPSVLGKKAHL